MQKNSLRICFCLGFILLSSQVFANDIKADSKIVDVTIYPGAALVTRQAEIEISPGDHTVFFENIIPVINESSLTVKGQGTAEVKIFGASIKTEYLTQSSDQRVKALQAQIEAVDDEITVQNSNQSLLQKQVEYLESIRLFEKVQIPKDLVTKTPAVADLEQVGTYVTKGLAEISLQGEGIRLKLRELNRKREAKTLQLQELNSNNQNVKRSIVVEIQGVRPGKLSLMVSYLVGGVNWQPLYDARVAFDKNEVNLSLFGLITQSTGEDWTDVHLTISTSRPSIGGMMPDLASWILRPQQMYRTLSKSSADDIGDQFSPSPTNVASMRQIAGFSGAQELKEELKSTSTAYAQTEEKGVSVVFKITKTVSIKSDGSQKRVPITVLTLPAQFEYSSTPKLSSYAYLRTLVENNQSSVLLPGQVNVFLDGDYVGASAISKALGNKEKFFLYLGADEGVTVKRELVEEKSDDTMFGGIPSPNKTDRYVYKITAQNFKSKAIKISLLDHIPVSQDDKIKVKDVKFSLEASQKDYKDKKGVMVWTVTLNPQEKKEITYSYTIERPRNLNIEGL